MTGQSRGRVARSCPICATDRKYLKLSNHLSSVHTLYICERLMWLRLAKFKSDFPKVFDKKSKHRKLLMENDQAVSVESLKIICPTNCCLADYPALYQRLY